MKVRTQIQRFLAKKRSRARNIRKEHLPSNVYSIIMESPVMTEKEQDELLSKVNEEKSELIKKFNNISPDWTKDKDLLKSFDAEHKEILQKYYGHLRK